MKEDTITLVAKGVEYGSQNDEAAFFEWLDKLNDFTKYEGEGDSLYIHVNSRVNEATLRDLLALFHRYNIDMKQFTIFDRKKFAPWFRDKRSYWHSAVFGAASKKSNASNSN